MTTMKVLKRLSTVNTDANGAPYLRINDGGEVIYLIGVTALTEIAIVAKTGITGNVILKHLDRLGNANHAVAADPGMTRTHAFEQTAAQKIGLTLSKREAMLLWRVLDKLLASTPFVANEVVEVDVDPSDDEPVRWMRDRLARQVQRVVGDVPEATTHA